MIAIFSVKSRSCRADRQVTCDAKFYKLFMNCAALNTRDKNHRLIGTVGENIFSQCGTALRPQYAIACIFTCEKARDLHCSTFQRDFCAVKHLKMPVLLMWKALILKKFKRVLLCIFNSKGRNTDMYAFLILTCTDLGERTIFSKYRTWHNFNFNILHIENRTKTTLSHEWNLLP